MGQDLPLSSLGLQKWVSHDADTAIILTAS